MFLRVFVTSVFAWNGPICVGFEYRYHPAMPKSPELSFEEALESVETIIDRIEAGELGIEAAIEQYEQGTKHLQRCRGILNRVEQRITELHPPEGPPEPPAVDDAEPPF